MRKHAALLTAVSVVAVLPAIWQGAKAGDLTISTNRTTPVTTSQGDGSGAGNITVDSNGAVTVTSGAAVTVDSNNTVDNEGNITSKNDTGAIGISIAPASGTLTGGVTNNGTITANISSKTSTGTGPNYGIFVSGAGTFSGDILNASASTGTIDVYGENSFGIRVSSTMVGNVTNNGTIQLFDPNSTGIRLDSALTGNIDNAGALTVSVSGGTGLFIGGPVSGQVVNNKSIYTGVAATTDTSGNAVAQQSGGPGIYVGASVTGGLLNNGNELTSAEEATITAEISAGQDVTNFTPDATISTLGSGIAIDIEPLANGSLPVANVDLGPVTTGSHQYGFVNLGSISASSGLAGTEALAIKISGLQLNGSTYTTTVENGLYNGRGATIAASASDTNATAIRIGDYGIVPSITNVSTISATTLQSVSTSGTKGPGGNTVAIDISALGEVDSINNSGTIAASSAGDATNATAIIDRGGKITNIVNSGTISALLASGSTGTATALDLSASTSDITVTNTGIITGGIKLGSGNDRLEIDGGQVNGTIDTGAGANIFDLSNSSFTGSFVAPAGTVDLNVTNSTVALANSAGTQVRNASFDAASTLKLTVYGETNLQGGLVGSGTISFKDGTHFAVAFNSLLLSDQTNIPVVQANAITFQSDVSGLDLTANPALYVPNLTFGSSGTDTIYVSLRRKTATELGLNASETAIYEPALEGLASDQTLGAAFANLPTTGDIRSALDQLLPDLTGSLRYAAVASDDIAHGAIDRRLGSLREVNVIQSLPKDQGIFIGDRGLSPWVQEFVTIAHQDASAGVAGYHGFNWGGAFGADLPMLGLDAMGLSFAEVYSQFNQRQSANNPITNFSSQISLYATKSFGGLFADAVGTFGFNSASNTRNIAIGTETRSPHGSWSGQQYSGKIQAGYRAHFGIFGLKAEGHLDYLQLKSDSYTETNGDGANLAIDKSTWTSETAGGDVALQATFNVEDWSIVTPEIRGGWTHDLKNQPYVINGKFAGGTQTFTLTGTQPSADNYYGGAGLTFISDWGVIAIDYDREWDAGFVANSFGATIRWWF
jgi:uncharacterized protein with beta-barrel porin domain